jgi:predicted signal transduction protein with EAL and GGDEF domain
MEAQETAELIEQSGHGSKQQNRSALTISILAMVLAIASLGGSNAMKEATQENILAANAYAFYQAKNIRQTDYKLAAADLELQMAREPNMNANAKAMYEKKLGDYKKTIERYESEPDTREGKKELMARAKEHEAIRDHAMQQDPWFDYAEGALQIAIVLLSVSIVASIPALYWAGTLLGALGFVSTLNGYFLFF